MTPHSDHCLPGITRASILSLAGELGIPTVERRLSLMELYTADEVWCKATLFYSLENR